MRNAEGDNEVKVNGYVLGGDKVFKAYSVPGVAQSNAMPTTALNHSAQLLDPRFDPVRLAEVYQTSAHLRPPIGAMVANIDAMGHVLEPFVDLSSAEADEIIKTALITEGVDDGLTYDEATPSDDDIAAAKEILARDQRIERVHLDRWFASVGIGTTWTELRKRTRLDLEITGNAYWEILRGTDDAPAVGRDGSSIPLGPITRIRHLRSPEFRLARSDGKRVDVARVVRTSPVAVDIETDSRKVRRFVQMVGGHTVWFREFGDPRTVSSKTGVVYESEDELHRTEGADAVPATEVIHFSIYDSLSVYGVPRWAGTRLSVLGSTAADEVNLDYFDSKPPAGMLLVTGGRLGKKTVGRLEKLWEAQARGRAKFHGLVVIEAVEGGLAMQANGSGKAAVSFQPLTGTQQSDALFSDYDRENANKIGRSWRLSPILRGDSRDANRATAQAAVAIADEQVFSDERKTFDTFVTDTVLPQAGFTRWRFITNSPAPSSDPIELTNSIANLMDKSPGLLSINEARRMLSKALNEDLDPVDNQHTDPMELAKVLSTIGEKLTDVFTPQEVRVMMARALKVNLEELESIAK
jgi:capsid portal protein